ncbi:MAG: LysR family transcriptional regulator [Rickettsiales bacterium]|jgi:LysR family hydrogen peroxide-inducible transcriptional activator|nr:LysR family transcriptional regulator [Rickettsiales bacterium]
MNLRDLQYLVAVADHLHFGKASRECHVSQPTLSMQLKKLEDFLGVQLFERSNKSVMLTPIGERITAKARRVLQDSQDIRETARMAQDPYAGDFRLGAFPTLAPYFLPMAVPAIHRALPKLTLLLVEEKTPLLLERLKAGSLDAAFLALPIEEEGLETVPLFDDPFMLAVPEHHPLAARKEISQQDLNGEELLLLEDGHCLRSQALEVCSLVGSQERQEFRATSLETLRQMVATGVGITLIPKMAVREGEGIRYIPFVEPMPVRTIGLVRRKNTAREVCIQAVQGIVKAMMVE